MTHNTSDEAPSFLTLLDVHYQLDELFRQHQECVLSQRFDRAREHLDAFERELRSHMQFEEDELFDLFERAEPIRGAGRPIFHTEHEKLLRYVAGIRRGLDELFADRHIVAVRIIELLDFESRFKNLMAHHDERERAYLYPTLDRVTTTEERYRLLGKHIAAEMTAGA